MYGGQYGLYSPYNLYCLNPPIIFYQGQPILIVTRNAYVQTNGLAVIDPDLLLRLYVQLASSMPTVDLVQVQLNALSQSSQANAQAINNAMSMVANLFH
ncbi:hypothetical protein [Nostoc sp. PA-18-2419]|uniref:hypothetical protein n=1 Tax=Nostoc sp. PA-18-2419 TaxID=2575443 RepID=UPI001CB9CEEA|nr:hypothetical protein [Nostoc sp. PA-18-2419]